MKLHGNENMEEGFRNLKKHYDNLTGLFGVNVVVTLNRFGFDTAEEIALFRTLCAKHGMLCAVSNGFCDGGNGCIELANEVASECEKTSGVRFLYELTDDPREKITRICIK